jgi:hypothetical protein
MKRLMISAFASVALFAAAVPASATEQARTDRFDILKRN